MNRPTDSETLEAFQHLVRSFKSEGKKKKRWRSSLSTNIHMQAPTIDTKTAMSTQVGKRLLIIEQIDECENMTCNLQRG